MLGAAAFFGVLWVGGADAASLGVVNVPRVIANSKPGRDAQESVKKEKERLEDVIKSKRANLEKMAREARDLQNDIEQKGAIWREEEREKKNFELRNRQRDLAREQDNLKRLIQESQRDLSERERRVMSHVIREVRDVVHEVAKEEKLQIVVDSGVVLYASPAVDITDKVIKRYESQKKK